MQVETITNDSGVSVIIVPENEMEEQLLKQLMKQENSIVEIRNPINIITKTIKSGLLIAKKSTSIIEQDAG